MTSITRRHSASKATSARGNQQHDELLRRVYGLLIPGVDPYNSPFSFQGTICRSTDLAVLAEPLAPEKPRAWLPKSQTELIAVRHKQDTYIITIPYWLAREKGLLR